MLCCLSPTPECTAVKLYCCVTDRCWVTVIDCLWLQAQMQAGRVDQPSHDGAYYLRGSSTLRGCTRLVVKTQPAWCSRQTRQRFRCLAKMAFEWPNWTSHRFMDPKIVGSRLRTGPPAAIGCTFVFAAFCGFCIEISVFSLFHYFCS